MLCAHASGSEEVTSARPPRPRGSVQAPPDPLLSCRRELFSVHNGARADASKILIVITDGKKIGDSLEYDDVISKANDKGIIRYAVGVGCGMPAFCSLFGDIPFRGRNPSSRLPLPSG